MKIRKVFMTLFVAVLPMITVGCSDESNDDQVPAHEQIDPLEGGVPMNFMSAALAGQIEGDLNFAKGEKYERQNDSENWQYQGNAIDLLYCATSSSIPIPVKDSRFYVSYFTENAQNDYLGGEPWNPGKQGIPSILTESWNRYCFLEDRQLVPYIAVPMNYDRSTENVQFGVLDYKVDQQNSKGVRFSVEGGSEGEGTDQLYTYTYLYSPFNPQTESLRLYYSTLGELYNDLLNRLEQKIGNELPVSNPEQYGITDSEFGRVPVQVIRDYLFDVELHKWVGMDQQ